jgi:hypothetical protein
MALANASGEGRAERVLVWIAFTIVVVTDFGYLLIIRVQDSNAPDAFTVPFVAAFLALMAVMLGVSLISSSPAVRIRPALRAGAAAGLLVSGTLALMSIGIVLVLAGVLAAVAALMSLAGRGLPVLATEVVAAALVVVVLIAGFEVTQRLIVCPASGSSGGGGPGFITGGYHWECIDGRLYMHSGFCNSGSGTVDSNGNATTTCH